MPVIADSSSWGAVRSVFKLAMMFYTVLIFMVSLFLF